MLLCILFWTPTDMPIQHSIVHLAKGVQNLIQAIKDKI